MSGTDTTSNVFPANTLNKIGFNGGTNGVTNFYGNTKQLQYFDTALNNTELEYMTSYRSFNEMAIELLYTIE